jgi:signal transduction histidine kinase
MMTSRRPRPYSRSMPTLSLRALAAPRRVDLLVAAGLLGWALPDVPWWWRPPGHGAATPVVLGYLALALVQSVPFLWRRRWPVVVLGVAAAVLLARLALGANPISAFAALLVAAYGLGAYGDHARRFARWLGGASLVAAAALALDGGGVGNRGLGLPWALLGAAFVVGDAASARRAETAAAVEAAHLAERTRIARELHDVLAHQLSAIAVRSGAARLAATAAPAPATQAAATAEAAGPARRLAAAGSPPEWPETQPDRGSVEALAAVEQLSREALAELGHLLGALRREPDDDLRRPAPSLGSLDALLASTREAGVPVDLEVDGQVRPLSPGVELAAYRIIQEALTNVAKHAPAAPTRVVLRYRDDRIGLSVVNGPPPSTPPPDGAGPGRGVRGMRERAALYSGRLEAAPRPDGGFVVSGVLLCGDAVAGAGEAPA